MIRPNYLSEIKSRISTSENGAVFVAADFTDITDKKTASVGLTRLEADGLLKRVIRGVYYKPEYSNFLKEYIAPIPDNVSHATAHNFGWTIVPCGNTALNSLALSTQVPAIYLYISDGAYKKYSYNNTVIRFNRIAFKGLNKFIEILRSHRTIIGRYRADPRLVCSRIRHGRTVGSTQQHKTGHINNI